MEVWYSSVTETGNQIWKHQVEVEQAKEKGLIPWDTYKADGNLVTIVTIYLLHQLLRVIEGSKKGVEGRSL